MDTAVLINDFKNELSELNISFKENEPLSQHSTFKIGGKASLFVLPETREKLAATIRLSRQYNVRIFIAGRGSNVVYSDAGFDGAVISTLALGKIIINDNTIIADAGVSLIELAVAAARRSLSGLEFAYGIPGSLGGAVYMNAGAYDGEISGIVPRTVYYDTVSDTFGELSGDAHAFGYRESIYRSHPEYIILSAELTLSQGNRAEIEAKMNDFMSRRRDKQPLEYPSAGSAFKRYPGRYTAQMIDEAGLKGYSVGGAQVSEKHAGFIINKGGATAEDVKTLSEFIKKRIRDLHGIEIESEIIFVE